MSLTRIDMTFTKVSDTVFTTSQGSKPKMGTATREPLAYVVLLYQRPRERLRRHVIVDVGGSLGLLLGTSVHRRRAGVAPACH